MILHISKKPNQISDQKKLSFDQIRGKKFIESTPLKVHYITQIWKSANIFVFIWKYVEDFTLKHFLLFEICAREICEKFVYKHSETIEHVKN